MSERKRRRSNSRPLATIIVSLEGFNMGDYEDWFMAVQKNNFPMMRELAAGMITEWPYAGDPTDPEAHRELQPDEWQEVLKAIGAAIDRNFRS